MTITYRGVCQSRIAESIEHLAMVLLMLDIGPRTTEAAEFWVAQDGVAAHIRRAGSKAEIAAALQMKTPQSNFTTADWLNALYNDLLPNLYATASSANQKVALPIIIQSVMNWNGFHSSGMRFGVFYPEDQELKTYREEKLRLPYHDRARFSDDSFKGPYTAYEVYATTSTADAVQALRAYAKANDLEDEFVTSQGAVYATESFARLALQEIAAIQAFGHDGKLLTKDAADAPRPPKP